MVDWITGIIERGGYLGIAALMLLENVFPPIPSELIMPMSGFVVRRGAMSLTGVVLAGTLGALSGAVAWYLIGRRVGERRVRAWVDRHGRWLAISCDDIDRAADWFRRRGRMAVLVGRLIPGVRTFISVPAGFAPMPPGPFVLYSAVGSALWTWALAYSGYLLGARYDEVRRVLDVVGWVVIGGILALYVHRLARGKGRR